MFVLNSTLENDSFPLLETELCLIRLINDNRYPWVLVVPKVENARELHDLSHDQQMTIMTTATALGRVLKSGFGADKINTAAIGNMVPQLHVHVVARWQDDAAWPGPVWGVGDMEPLKDAELARRVTIIRDGMCAE